MSTGNFVPGISLNVPIMTTNEKFNLPVLLAGDGTV